MNVLQSLKNLLTPAPAVPTAEIASRVTAGNAILIDVREPQEWSGGVAEGAELLPMSDLNGSRKQWARILAQAKGRELIVYCAAGGRAGKIAQQLVQEGFRATNAGGLRDLAAAGWRIIPPPEAMLRRS